MIRARITKSGSITNLADFATQELAEAWAEAESAKGSFGLGERWVKDIGLGSLDPDDALESRVYDELGQTGTEYRFAAEFSIAYEDVSAEYAEASAMAAAEAKQAVGARVMAKVRAINEVKDFDEATRNAMLADASLAAVERLLWMGALVDAKALIQAMGTTYYSADDKAALVAIIDDSGLI